MSKSIDEMIIFLEKQKAMANSYLEDKKNAYKNTLHYIQGVKEQVSIDLVKAKNIKAKSKSRVFFIGGEALEKISSNENSIITLNICANGSLNPCEIEIFWNEE